MRLNFFKYFLVLGTLCVTVLTSCIKNEVKDLGDAGKTFIKLLEAPENTLFFEPFTGTKAVDLVSIRRDANSSAELNKGVTINLRLDTAAIRAYNTAHNESFERLPDSLFAITTSGITKTGDLTYSVVFSPGEFAKEFTISLNGSKWDLSRKYTMPFVIADPGGLAISSDKGEAMTLISIKNQWDGIYSIEDGFVQRYTAPGAPEAAGGLNGSIVGNPDVALITAGPTTMAVPPASTPGAFMWAVGNNSYVAGIDGIRLAIDPSTNLVTVSSLGNPTLANWEDKPNRYDPATKTFYLNFRWNPTANRREYSVVLKYKGPR